MDKYNNFSDMVLNESNHLDYLIQNRGSDVSIISIHGGEIEPGTTELTLSIAKDDFNYYSLIGDKEDTKDVDMHITSTRFDDKRCLEIVENSDVCVSLHGCIGKEKEIILGGWDYLLRDTIYNTLKKHFNDLFNIIQTEPTHKFSALSMNNIANRTRTQKGVQMEFSQGFRKLFISDLKRTRTIINQDFLNDFSEIIRESIFKTQIHR